MEVNDSTGRDGSGDQDASVFDLFIFRAIGLVVVVGGFVCVVALAAFLAAELHCKWNPEARRCVVEEQRSEGDWP